MKRYIIIFSLLATLMATAGDVPRIYINPGHGGHDSNDRPTPFYHAILCDTITYYESDSNLLTGLSLEQYLRNNGYETAISRTGNTSDDDLDLYEIVALAANSGADLFYSIHSNATGVKTRLNYTLSLYRGYHGSPIVEGSDSIARATIKHLQANQATVWTHNPITAGDWDFFSNWGYKTGLGVLKYNKVPGMLCEGSFFDYVPERCRKLNADFCALEGWNQALAINEYFGNKGKNKTGIVAGIIRVNSERVDTAYCAFAADLLQPANSVVVQLCDKKKRPIRYYTTDRLNNGFYCFTGLEPGKYYVRLEQSDTMHAVTVRRNQSTYCNITTSPIP